MKIILGSQSKDRQRILKEMGYTFDIVHADIDEKAIRSDDPEELTVTIANAKADAVLPKIHEPSILITADTVVVCEGRILEKPENEHEARKFFALYPFHPAIVFSAVVVVNTATKKRRSGCEQATVWLAPFPESVIQELIDTKKTFAWAGGFAVADPVCKPFIKKIEGPSDAVEGLPRALVTQYIKDVSEPK